MPRDPTTEIAACSHRQRLDTKPAFIAYGKRVMDNGALPRYTRARLMKISHEEQKLSKG